MSELFITKFTNKQPDKILGEEGNQARMYIAKLPEGRQVCRIEIEAGFDWNKSIKPILPGCPDWCPATHFGYLESGEMGIEMEDRTKKTIKAGETYFIPSGHIPVINQNTVMVEFSQDTTYTNKEFMEKSK